MRFGELVALILVTGTALQLRAAITGPDFSLTYDKPAEKWTEACRSATGGSAPWYSGERKMSVCRSTRARSGAEVRTTTRTPRHTAHLEEIRRLIFAGKVDEAEKLSETMMGQPKLLMPYQPFCDLRLHFPGHGQATDYRRRARI